MILEQIIVVFFIVGTITILWFLWLYELKMTEKNFLRFNETNKINVRIAEKLAEWQRKIADFEYMLTGESWRDSTGKEEFIAAVYDGVPIYLWYALEEKDLLNHKLEPLIYKLFWDGNPGFGDLEFHVSQRREVEVALRIRNPKRFVKEIVFEEKIFPLYQAGHSSFGTSEAGCVSFLSIYDKEVVA